VAWTPTTFLGGVTGEEEPNAGLRFDLDDGWRGGDENRDPLPLKVETLLVGVWPRNKFADASRDGGEPYRDWRTLAMATGDLPTPGPAEAWSE